MVCLCAVVCVCMHVYSMYVYIHMCCVYIHVLHVLPMFVNACVYVEYVDSCMCSICVQCVFVFVHMYRIYFYMHVVCVWCVAWCICPNACV